MNIAVYCGSSAGSKEAYTIGAVALGMWIAENDTHWYTVEPGAD